MMSLLQSWTRWFQTRRLEAKVRRLRRQVAAQERVLALQVECLQLLDRLEHPRLPEHLLPQPEPQTQPEPQPQAPELPPPLTPEEMAALQEEPMPDPMEEIEYRLGLSTTPQSQQTWGT